MAECRAAAWAEWVAWAAWISNPTPTPAALQDLAAVGNRGGLFVDSMKVRGTRWGMVTVACEAPSNRMASLGTPEGTTEKGATPGERSGARQRWGMRCISAKSET